MNKYESIINTYDNAIKMLIWKDKKNIYNNKLLWRIYNIIKERFDYENKIKYKIEIQYPIEQYNMYMKGVDYMDKNISFLYE